MNEYLVLIPVFLAGTFLGALFFGGLWWTVPKGLASEWPGIWFLGSLLIRTAVVLAGFIFVSQGLWLRLAACLCGFVIARCGIMTCVGRAVVDERSQSQLGVPRAH